MVERESVAAHDVDVGLRELARATLLGPLTAPDLLDLVATEWELEVPRVLQDIARERHGQVEVESEAGIGFIRICMETTQDVDLLVDLTLA